MGISGLSLNNIMTIYLAELTEVHLDSLEILKNKWLEQLKLFPNNYEWITRNYIALNKFTLYFQNLILEIVKHIPFQYKDLLIHHHDSSYNYHSELDPRRIHVDAYRKTCITIPLTEIQDPINFYNKRNISPNHAVKTSYYSKLHPMAVNVSEFHNVPLGDFYHSRILLQINYDHYIDEIISYDKDIWNIL